MNQLFTYFIADCGKAMKHKDASKLFGADLTQELKPFFSQLSENMFVEDVKAASSALQGAHAQSVIAQMYAYALSFVVFATTEHHTVTLGNGAFVSAVVEFVHTTSFHDVMREIKRVAKAVGVSYAQLQVATDIDTQTRLAIRSDFRKKYPNTLLIISVQPDLLGGVRLFKDNTVVDMSWNAQLQSILSV